MKSHRTIISTGFLLAALVVGLPAPALASPLLSGYGGPGQGNQAILGSALLNGPRGGGGSGNGSSGGSSGASGSSSSTGTEGGASSSAPVTGTSGKSAPSGSGGSGSGGSGTTSDATRGSARKGSRQGAQREATAAAASFYPASERTVAGEQTGAFGMSGDDLLYIVLAVGTLAFMGVFTRRLGRPSGPEGIGS